MSTETRILLADDHPIVRRGLRSLLEQAGWTVCAEADDGRSAAKLAREHLPDIVVMDISMPGMNGLDGTTAVRKACPTAQVLILSMYESEQFVREVLAAGARGYVMKSDAPLELVAAVNALRAGKTFFSSSVAKTVARSGWEPQTPLTQKRPPGGLTHREREVVQLLAEGETNKGVADKLQISVKTVETHRARIMSKLSLKTVADLVRYAIRNLMVEP